MRKSFRETSERFQRSLYGVPQCWEVYGGLMGFQVSRRVVSRGFHRRFKELLGISRDFGRTLEVFLEHRRFRSFLNELRGISEAHQSRFIRIHRLPDELQGMSRNFQSISLGFRGISGVLGITGFRKNFRTVSGRSNAFQSI